MPGEPSSCGRLGAAAVLMACTVGGFIHLLLLCAFMVSRIQRVAPMVNGRCAVLPETFIGHEFFNLRL